VLSEEIVIAALRQVRERLDERSAATNAELLALQTEAERLRGEIGRLVAAIAAGGTQPQALVEAVAERQERLTALDARLKAAQAAPSAIDLEVRRLEREARGRIAELRTVLERTPTRRERSCARCSTAQSPARRSRPQPVRGFRSRGVR